MTTEDATAPEWAERLGDQYAARQVAALRGDEKAIDVANFWIGQIALEHVFDILQTIRAGYAAHPPTTGAIEALRAERDAALDREATLRRMLDLVMAIPEMTDEQLIELKRNCLAALAPPSP